MYYISSVPAKVTPDNEQSLFLTHPPHCIEVPKKVKNIVSFLNKVQKNKVENTNLRVSEADKLFNDDNLTSSKNKEETVNNNCNIIFNWNDLKVVSKKIWFVGSVIKPSARTLCKSILHTVTNLRIVIIKKSFLFLTKKYTNNKKLAELYKVLTESSYKRKLLWTKYKKEKVNNMFLFLKVNLSASHMVLLQTYPVYFFIIANIKLAMSGK